jgi:hypothetical protein
MCEKSAVAGTIWSAMVLTSTLRGSFPTATVQSPCQRPDHDYSNRDDESCGSTSHPILASFCQLCSSV